MYYFEPDKRKEMLQKELLAWVGTPYRHQCRIKQVGADCIGILLYKFGKISSHAGVYCNGYVFQSVSRHSVAKIRVQDRLWYPRLTFVFRILD